MTIEHDNDLIGLRRAGALVARVLREMGKAVAPGVRPVELDEIAQRAFREAGATSAPQKAYQFPGATCISVNSSLAHGVSSRKPLREGDLINIDVSAELDGYWADTGGSFPVGNVKSRLRRLLKSTRKARDEAVAEVRAGRPLNVIGRAVQRRAKRDGFQVIRNLGGHGVGRFIHEEPHVSNISNPLDRTKLKEGWVLAVEPFLTTGARNVVEDADGWTLKTPDGTLGAQFEHTIVVTQGEPIILTL
ncbi:MAG: type I methionyl aminopeptidase [Myxococcota bacterium]